MEFPALFDPLIELFFEQFVFHFFNSVFVVVIPAVRFVMFLGLWGFLFDKGGESVVGFLDIVHKDKFVEVCVGVGVAKVFVVVAVEQSGLSLFGPVFFVEGLDFLVFIVNVFVFDFHIDSFVVVLSFGIVVLPSIKGHLTASAFASLFDQGHVGGQLVHRLKLAALTFRMVDGLDSLVLETSFADAHVSYAFDLDIVLVLVRVDFGAGPEVTLIFSMLLTGELFFEFLLRSVINFFQLVQVNFYVVFNNLIFLFFVS